MGLAVVKIIFADGGVGYFKDNTVIVSKIDNALQMNVEFAKGLARGLNFAIDCYDDEKVVKAVVEVL